MSELTLLVPRAESSGAVDKDRQAVFQFAAIDEVFLNGTAQSYALSMLPFNLFCHLG
jgi:hypothetical protein